jgi:hypothetical protein
LQYVRKISGYRHPSKLNETAFNDAVSRISAITKQLIDTLETASPPRNREVEIARARAKAQKRFGHTERLPMGKLTEASTYLNSSPQ